MPDFNFFFINIPEKPDSEIVSLELGLVRQMFLLFKHVRNTKKLELFLWEIFNFASANLAQSEVAYYFSITIQYISFATPLTKIKIKAMIKGKLEQDDRDWATMSRVELLYDKEELDAIKFEGKLEGELKTIKAVLKKQADWSDEKIADLLDVSVDLVAHARRETSEK